MKSIVIAVATVIALTISIVGALALGQISAFGYVSFVIGSLAFFGSLFWREGFFAAVTGSGPLNDFGKHGLKYFGHVSQQGLLKHATKSALIGAVCFFGLALFSYISASQADPPMHLFLAICGLGFVTGYVSLRIGYSG
jgi:hypothetical protein